MRLKIRTLAIVLGLVVAAGFASAAYGWNDRGHMTVAYIAYKQLTPAARTRVDALVADTFSPMKYDGAKGKALLDEDRVIGAMKLGIPASHVTVTPIADVFAK